MVPQTDENLAETDSLLATPSRTATGAFALRSTATPPAHNRRKIAPLRPASTVTEPRQAALRPMAGHSNVQLRSPSIRPLAAPSTRLPHTNDCL